MVSGQEELAELKPRCSGILSGLRPQQRCSWIFQPAEFGGRSSRVIAAPKRLNLSFEAADSKHPSEFGLQTRLPDAPGGTREARSIALAGETLEQVGDHVVE